MSDFMSLRGTKQSYVRNLTVVFYSDFSQYKCNLALIERKNLCVFARNEAISQSFGMKAGKWFAKMPKPLASNNFKIYFFKNFRLSTFDKFKCAT